MTRPPPPLTPKILVVNAGSSSLKYRLVDAETGATDATGMVSEVGSRAARHVHTEGESGQQRQLPCPTHAEAFAAARTALDGRIGGGAPADLLAVGHRVVHGGARLTAPVLVDDEVLRALEQLTPLAPLHNPANIEGIRRSAEAFPGVPQVAVFDTGFHATIPEAAHTYAVPGRWRTEHGVRRYGFHGTSYASVTRRTAALLGRAVDDTNLVVLHLGNGASACAVRGGRSVDTSMGLTPVAGLVMGTRSGDVDPALGGYLERVAGVSAAEYDRALSRESGLLGLCGDSDLRTILARRASGDAEAALAVDVAAHRVRAYVGAYTGSLPRVDALVFTGGIGENSHEMRAAVVGGLGGLGLALDDRANIAGPAERVVSSPSSRVPVWVVPTDEEGEIARASLEVVRGSRVLE